MNMDKVVLARITMEELMEMLKEASDLNDCQKAMIIMEFIEAQHTKFVEENPGKYGYSSKA